MDFWSCRLWNGYVKDEDQVCNHSVNSCLQRDFGASWQKQLAISQLLVSDGVKLAISSKTANLLPSVDTRIHKNSH